MSKINDLLPLPPGINKPSAYDVFGLSPGEQNGDKIIEAAIGTIEHLKSVKDQTEPKLWQQAARMVDQARQILSDPQRKAALDAMLGAMSDPLAGLLPAGDPFAAVTPVTGTDPQPESVAMPPGLFGTPLETDPTLASTAARSISMPTGQQQPVQNPVVQPTSRSKRRRGRRSSPLSRVLLGSLTVALLSLIGLLAYFMFFGPGKVELVKSGNKLTISTIESQASPLQANRARPVEQPQPTALRPDKPSDPVMGDLGQPRSNNQIPMPGGVAEPVSETAEIKSAGKPDPPWKAPSTDQAPTNQAPTDLTPTAPTATAPTPTAPKPTAVPKPSVPKPSVPKPSVPKPSVPKPSVPKPSVPIPAGEPFDQPLAIQQVRQLIREANWEDMKPAAEALIGMPLSPENEAQAQSLYELTDLATYYRGAISKAVGELEVGNDFAVTDSFRVIVVETGADYLQVRYNKKNRSFTLDEFPFSLAHKLATFQVPAGPTGQAAKAVYQAIAPTATDAHREQAIGWLRAISGEVPGANPSRLAETIQSIYREQ